MKKTICIVLCIAAMFAFVSCKKDGGQEETTISTTAQSETVSTTQKPAEPSTTKEQSTSQTTTEKTTDKTTKKEPSTKENEAIPITVNEAIDSLTEFYGAAYKVHATVKEGSIQYFKITDTQDNLYARVEVNLKTSDAKETIEHSGEVNEFNLSV